MFPKLHKILNASLNLMKKHIHRLFTVIKQLRISDVRKVQTSVELQTSLCWTRAKISENSKESHFFSGFRFENDWREREEVIT